MNENKDIFTNIEGNDYSDWDYVSPSKSKDKSKTIED